MPQGMMQKDIAPLFDVDRSVISRVITGKVWNT